MKCPLYARAIDIFGAAPNAQQITLPPCHFKLPLHTFMILSWLT
ncbi:MAG: hypothetical protein WBW36_00050 [Candidatus Sulfotelmatobacter sp.]